MFTITKRIVLSVVCISMVFVLSSCSTFDPFAGAYQDASDNVGLFYSDLEMNFREYEGPARNPVIVIHGFLGAKLENIHDKQKTWGTFAGREIVGGFRDKHLKDLSYPMVTSLPLERIIGNAKAYSMMTDVDIKVLGMHVHQSAYQNMLDILISKGFIPESQVKAKGKNFASLYPFFYDWRRDNVQNVQQLHQFILKKRKELQKKYEELYGIKNFDVKFNIVGHSMGGMITRYYLMYGDQAITEDQPMPKPDWRGTKYVERAVIVGTPNLGYLNTLFELTHGLQIDPRMPVIPKGVVGTWASIYQMLPFACTKSVKYADSPKGQSLDLYDPKLWIDMKWGLTDPKQDEILKVLLPDVDNAAKRRGIAINHLKKCLKRAEKFSKALQADSPKPDNIALFLFLGDSINTRKTAVVDRNTGDLKVTHLDGGDGVVLTTSARMDTAEKNPWEPFIHSNVGWHSVVHLNAAHMGITETTGFGDNVTYYLMLLPVKGSAKRHEYLKKTLSGSPAYMNYFKRYSKKAK